jgi:hypothetical protein
MLHACDVGVDGEVEYVFEATVEATEADEDGVSLRVRSDEREDECGRDVV